MPAVSEKQKKAMYSAAEGKSKLGIPASVGKEYIAADGKIKGAGIMLITPQDEVLFLLRSPTSNHPEEWDLPGGRADDDETAEETAKRECAEEIGAAPYGELKKIGDTSSKDDSGSDVDFITFKQYVMHKFVPKLDQSEHTQYKWASLQNPPEPLHPGVRDVVNMVLGKKTANDAMPAFEGMAFDRYSVGIVLPEMANDFASVRTIDVDGRMHISQANITREQVAPYYGSEIPDYQELGLDPQKVYQVYRPAEELEKAVKTFNLIPLLSKHIPISSKKPEKELVCGSTGSSAVWDAPYIKNSMVVTVAADIEGIEQNKKRELSAGYYYKPVMEDGIFEGQPYQIRMVDIVANHLALVEKGRAGPTVVVGDASSTDVSINPNGVSDMSDIALSKKATKAKGALLAVLKPIMATDAQANISVTLDGILADVKKKNWLVKKPGILAAIKPLLAKDADLKDVVALLDKLDGAPADDDNVAQDDAAEKCEAIMAKLRGKISDEDLAEIESMMKAAPAGATDEPPQTANAANADPKNGENKKPIPGATDTEEDKEDMVSKKEMTKAMDAAMKSAAKEAEEKTIARLTAIAEAKEITAAKVGSLVACDSAEGYYEAALKLKKIDTKGVPPVAYKAMVQMLPDVGTTAPRVPLANDSAMPANIAEMFPDANRLIN